MNGEKLRVTIEKVAADNSEIEHIDTVEMPMQAVQDYMEAMAKASESLPFDQ